LEENHLFSAQQELGPSKSQEISTWKLALNMLNSMEGVGFLALPYAIHEGGITAVIAFCVLPFIMGYTANLLSESLDYEDECGEKKRHRWSYQEMGMHVWAPFKPISWIFVSTILFLCAVSYIVLCSSLMSQQFPHVPITESQWACLGTLLVFPTVFLERLSQIAWISLISILALLATTGVALSYEFQDISQWDFQSLLFWDTRGVFVGLSIITFSYGIHALVVTMAAEVSDQSKFKVALVWTFVVGAVFKVVFALSGFLTYGRRTSEVILNNLPAGIPAKVIAVFFTLNVLLSYPISVLVIVRNIEELSVYEKLTNKIPSTICFVSLRIAIVLVILGFAVWMPHFALINALGGCVNFFVCLVFPGLFHLCLKYKQLTKLQVSVDGILVILGTIGFGFGLVTSIMKFEIL